MRVRRDRWGVPHIEADDADDLYFAQGFCHGQDRLWQMDFYRRVVCGRLSEMAGAGGAAGRPPDAHPRHPPRRRARGGGAGPRAARPAGALLRGVNAAAASARGAALRDAAAAPRVRALAAGRHPQPRQAARLRPLDQLGAGAAARRHGARARPGAGRPPRPRLSRPATRSSPRKPWSGDGLAIAEQIDAVRALDGAGRRGQRLQQLGGHRRAQRRPARR